MLFFPVSSLSYLNSGSNANLDKVKCWGQWNKSTEVLLVLWTFEGYSKSTETMVSGQQYPEPEDLSLSPALLFTRYGAIDK